MELNYKRIVYFLDCYCLMMNYDEPLGEIVAELVENEGRDITDAIIAQIKAVLALTDTQDEISATILADCKAFEYPPQALFDFLKVSLEEFEKLI